VKPLEGAVGAVPFFSPDGEWLAFYHSQSGSIRKIAVSGGAPVTVGTAPGLAGGTWGEDGNIITALFNLHIVPATGGAAKTLLEPDIKSGERCYRAPHYLPGGKAVLFTIGRENTDTFDDGQIAVLSLDTGKKKILIEGGMSARYSPTGHLVYGRNGSLLAVPFDLKRLEVTGRPTTVVDGVFMSVNAGMAAFSLSAQGDLVFAPGSVEGGERILHWVDRKGVAKPFSVPMRSYVHPRLSTDDARLAVEVEGPRHDIFAYDVSRAVLTRLSIDGNSHMPIWTLRGDRVTFRSERSGQPSAIWWAQSDGGGEVERLTPRGASPESWSPDGRALVYTVLHSDTGADVFMVALDGDHKPRPLVQTKFQEGSAKFSPDGMWVAYCSNESGRPEVYVTQRDGQGSRFQVSTEGGTDPVWRRNGGEMYYRNGDRMMIVSVSTQPNLKLSQPRPLWQGRYLHGVNSSCGPAGPTSSNYDVTADGERFVMIEDKTQDVAARQINVVLGFAEQLKRLAQSAN
jgi:serine/threonine-protein kinase